MRSDALAAWQAGVDGADAEVAVRRALACPDLAPWSRPDFFIATGKAAAAMADALGGGLKGVVLLPREAAAPNLRTNRLVLRADHPVPSPEGIAASAAIMEAARDLRRGQRLLYLVSGGTSSLFEVPRAGLATSSLIEVYRLLLTCGAPIDEVNVVRRALSVVKGGGLLRATPADVLTLAVSDVPADDPATIGSGPTVTIRETGGKAETILRRYGLWDRVAPDVRRMLGARRTPEEPRGKSAGFHVVCSAADAVGIASTELERRGYSPISCGLAELRGNVMTVAAAVAEAIGRRLGPQARSGFVLGGETTLRVPDKAGRGGRNQHLAAAIASRLAGRSGFALVCGGTDGVDGTGEHAGGVVDGCTAALAETAGTGLERALADFDTGTALSAAGDVLDSGATRTNVGDLLVAACASG